VDSELRAARFNPPLIGGFFVARWDREGVSLSKGFLPETVVGSDESSFIPLIPVHTVQNQVSLSLRVKFFGFVSLTHHP
jgi:hypothetical protein